jgi:hypothetical protein
MQQAEVYQITKRNTALKDGDSMFLQNDGIDLRNHTAPTHKTTPASLQIALSTLPKVCFYDICPSMPTYSITNTGYLKYSEILGGTQIKVTNVPAVNET